MRIDTVGQSGALAAAPRRRLSLWAALIPAIFVLGTPALAVKPYEPGEGGSMPDPYPELPESGENGKPESGGSASTTKVSVTGRVNSLKIQKFGNPIVTLALDKPAGCSTSPKTYFFPRSDADYDYALKALVAARLAGREVKLQGIDCPSVNTLISASSVRIIESSPQNGPAAGAPAGLHGRVTNLKIQQGVVYFRIAPCSGSKAYFKFTSTDLPGGLSVLLAAQSAKRPVGVFTDVSGTGACPAAGAADLDLGYGGLSLL